MTQEFEDRAEKVLLITIFSLLALQQALSVAATIQAHAQIDFWALTLTSRVFSLIFLLMIVVLTLTRLPPKNSATGIEPRLTAVAGTFSMTLLVVLPTAQVSYEWRLAAAILIVTGTVLSVYCLAWLGQSFAILASARRLVTGGPYAVVRHPLYIAEAVTVTGMVIANWSFPAAVLAVCTFLLQVRRMFNEERVLRSVFPEYHDYAARVPMILPWPRPRQRA
jgi:protein-S-isoprenylcysteine O-methyltransferase Ste14